MHFQALALVSLVSLAAAAPTDSTNATLEARGINLNPKAWIQSHVLNDCSTSAIPVDSQLKGVPPAKEGKCFAGDRVSVGPNQCVPFHPVTKPLGVGWGVGTNQLKVLAIFTSKDCSGVVTKRVERKGGSRGACWWSTDVPGMGSVKGLPGY